MAITINGSSNTITGLAAGGLPDDSINLADLSATGTASSSTFLRGDNSWAAAASNGITGPSFTVRRVTSHQDISTGTTTVVEFNSEDQDSHSAWDTSTYRFTPQVAGWYNISSQICYNTAAENHWMLIYIYKNGSSEAWAQLHTDGRAVDHLIQINKMVNLNGSSDYIDIRTHQDSGSTRGLQHRSGQTTWAQGFLVRAT